MEKTLTGLSHNQLLAVIAVCMVAFTAAMIWIAETSPTKPAKREPHLSQAMQACIQADIDAHDYGAFNIAGHMRALDRCERQFLARGLSIYE
jgi:hypothetical protein